MFVDRFNVGGLNGQEPNAVNPGYRNIVTPNPDAILAKEMAKQDQQVVSGITDAGANGHAGGGAAQSATARRLEEKKVKRNRRLNQELADTLDQLDQQYARMIALLDKLIEEKSKEIDGLTSDNQWLQHYMQQIDDGVFDLSDPQTRENLNRLGIDVHKYVGPDGEVDYDAMQGEMRHKAECNNTDITRLGREIEEMKERRTELQQKRYQSKENGLSSAQVRQELKELENEQALKEFELSIATKDSDGLSAEDEALLQAEYEKLYNMLDNDQSQFETEVSKLNALAEKAGIEIRQESADEPEVEKQALAVQTNGFSFSGF